jgi:hypothetical protein
MREEKEGFSMGEAHPVRDTNKAVLFYVDDLGREVWVPKSVIHDDSEVWKAGDKAGELVVMEWWASKQEWGG